MEATELVIALIVFTFIYTITLYVVKSFYKDSIKALNNSIDNMEKEKMLSHISYLKTLRREYALNILNLNEVLELDKKLDTYEKRVIRMDKQEFNIEISAFWSKYPVIEEFNPFGIAPHFAKYGDERFKLIDDDDFDKKNKYLEIGKYIVLLSRFLLYGGEPSIDRLNTGTDVEELKKTQRRYDDQRLRKIGIKALDVINKYYKNGSIFIEHEDNDFKIFRLLDLDNEDPPEYHFGIHIKNTKENIIYAKYNDGIVKSDSFYRANDKFNKLGLIELL